uniref:Large ribosomal subunit protein uL14 n=1 Tax=uncultured korarchaeote TaxID=161241 RepID=A0A1L2JM71_9CREN|nr:ribosomal protein L14 [uncultured korarchaeote]
MARRAVRRRKLKGVKPRVSRGLPVMAKLKCADNTGARILQIIGVIGYQGRKGRLPSASVGDMVVVVVKQGKHDLLHKPFKAVVIRQRKPFRRKSGQWVVFEDNAAILVNDDGTPRGSEVKGPVAKEALEKWPSLSAVSMTVV